MLKELNGKKGIQFAKSIKGYSNILSKRFGYNFERT
jgi:hypothetical protein